MPYFGVKINISPVLFSGKHGSSRAWYGMEWKMEWNGTEVSVWNMEDARMEWNGRIQEWNERQSSILPYQFHT